MFLYNRKGSQSGGGIFHLVFSQKGQVQGEPLIAQFRPMQPAGNHREYGRRGLHKPVMLLHRCAPDHLHCAGQLIAISHRHPIRLDNPRFFRSDLLHCITQYAGVVQGDGRDNGHQRRSDHICRVISPPQPHFQNDKIALLACKPQEAKCGGKVKLREGFPVFNQALCNRKHPLCNLDKRFPWDFFSIHSDALTKIAEKWGREKARPVSCFLQYGCNHRAGGALPVCTCHMNIFQTILGIPQLCQEFPDALHPGRTAKTWKRVNPLQGLFIGHCIPHFPSKIIQENTQISFDSFPSTTSGLKRARSKAIGSWQHPTPPLAMRYCRKRHTSALESMPLSFPAKILFRQRINAGLNQRDVLF